MKDHQLVVNVEGFRAVKKAELILDGITVVAGENGCGKSTLSKLLYYLFKTANEYEEVVIDALRKELRDVSYVIDELLDLMPSSKKDDDQDFGYFGKRRFRINSNMSTDELREYFYKVVSFLEEHFLHVNNKDLDNNEFLINRWRNILLHREYKYKKYFDKTDKEMKDLILNIEETLFDSLSRAETKIKSRPVDVFFNTLLRHFSESSVPSFIEIKEYEYSIISSDSSRISTVHSIVENIYIDTPMIVGLDGVGGYQHWKELNEKLRYPALSNSEYIFDKNFAGIIDGNISIDDDMSRRFVYKRSDGMVFNLLNCATGVKSFAVLQLLYKNGHLNDKTLLIIDEPEVHLHPQWIVEYARLMVLLNKELGVKFFIASHNPDMVSAIKYISEKEQTDANLNFYLAEKEENEFTYTYRHLGTEIDEIFGSFNIALERINQYGVQE